jgi:hypothetical protein
MKERVSAKFAGPILSVALGMLSIFHVLMLSKVLPADFVWGGQIQGAQANPILLALCVLRLAVEK